MPWEVEYTDEFGEWWQGLSEGQQDTVGARVELLMEYGPNLPYPDSSDIRGSRHGVMRELRVQSGGRPIRVFYACDPSERPSCSSAETRRATTGSTRSNASQGQERVHLQSWRCLTITPNEFPSCSVSLY